MIANTTYFSHRKCTLSPATRDFSQKKCRILSKPWFYSLYTILPKYQIWGLRALLFNYTVVSSALSNSNCILCSYWKPPLQTYRNWRDDRPTDRRGWIPILLLSQRRNRRPVNPAAIQYNCIDTRRWVYTQRYSREKKYNITCSPPHLVTKLFVWPPPPPPNNSRIQLHTGGCIHGGSG